MTELDPPRETGIVAYDLEPPAAYKSDVPERTPLRGPAPPELVYGFPELVRMLLPRIQMMRVPRVPPRWYQPCPQPEGTVRLVLGGRGYGDEPASFHAYQPHEHVLPESVFDVPAEQHERWKAAYAAFYAAQDEIESVIDCPR